MKENEYIMCCNKYETLVCELCCKQVKSLDCELLEGTLLEVLEVVLIKLNFTATQPAICKHCSKKLLDAFQHKSKWIYTEDRLFPYVNTASDDKVDIKTVYLDNSGCKQSDIESEMQICRLCLELINDNAWDLLLDVLEKKYSLEYFEKYVPDLNLNVTKNPIICKMCLDSLSVFMGFIEFCLDQAVKTEEYPEELKTEEYIIKDEEETKPVGFRINPAFTEDLELNKMAKCQDTLKCTKRPDVSRDKAHMLEHGLVHNTEKPAKMASQQMKMFQCAICSYETELKSNLTNHTLLHLSRSNKKLFICEICSFETNRKDILQRHILIHKPLSEVEVFKCRCCTYKTKQKGNLQTHILIHTPRSEVEVFKCDFCSFETKYKKNLPQHILIHKPLSEVEVFKCEFCSFETKYKHSLSGHMLVHKPLSQVEVFKCEICSFETKHKHVLPGHMLIHKSLSEVELFKCEFCSFETKRKRSLSRHMFIHKLISEVEVFKC